ncbi:hypothetical protein ACI0FM_14900 [Paenochrobactrum sp. BZR 588]
MASIGYLTIGSNVANAWDIDKQHIEALINLMQARLDGVTVGFLQASSGRDRAGTSPANMIFFRPERTQNSVTRRRMSSARIDIE